MLEMSIGDKVSLEFEDKLDILKEEYKLADPETLSELLLVCDGSLKKTRAILDETFQRTLSSKHALYQSSITSMFMGSKKRKVEQPKKLEQPGDNERTRIITLYDEHQVKEFLHPYVSLHKNFTPHKLSNVMLQYLMENKHKFSPTEFYMFEKKCKSDHSSGMLYLPGAVNTDDMYYNGVRHNTYELDNELLEVTDLVNSYLNDEIIPKYPKLPFQQPDFKCSGCVVNYYENLSNKLDWHSDRLQSIGPHCYIASLSLGSTREFRLRRHSQPKIIYSIHLPHNSLLLMHPGCQELFKHCVNPLKKTLQMNSLSQSSRFNLTFRYFPPNFTAHRPKCKCDLPMVLRRSYKSPNDENFGKYHWTCENVYMNKDCHTFHWADFNDPDNNFISQDNDSVSKWDGQ
ncbi:hypothetical protein CLIB1444_06S01420 [[Candida] jaroonii]|uniref:Uncharacterized protein n=1 Tax=[Candida] jaroonii TaxID=467808 RepID=A0ACA9Y9H5_9ASCO|nr:hypothetical protein CLIB1444_06S01420 [[Candida] jaroonii]